MCKRVLMAVMGVLLWCAAAEGGLRLLNVRFDASLFTPDPELGWALRPNAKGGIVSEGEAYVHINSVGMRDKERSIRKPPNTFRIAFLGDSMTEARQVALQDTYCARLEHDLETSAMKGRIVEVLNFGVPGYGTAQELLMLRNRVRKYKPDLVLLEFYFGNDLSDNHRALDYTKAGGRPYFVEKDGQLILDDSFRYRPDMRPAAIRRHNWLADLMNHSRLLLFLDVVKTKVRIDLTRKESRPDPLLPSDWVRSLMYIPPRTPYAIQTWRVTEGMLLMLRDEARSQGAGFLLLDFPMGMQITADQQKQREFMAKAGIDTLFYPNQRLESFARAHGIVYLSLQQPLADYVLQHNQRVTFGAGHFNKLGHRIVADALCDYISAHLDDLNGHPMSSRRPEAAEEHL